MILRIRVDRESFIGATAVFGFLPLEYLLVHSEYDLNLPSETSEQFSAYICYVCVRIF